MQKAKLGSVSEGTLRPQDLIPTFLDALNELNSPYYEAFVLNPAVPAYVFDEGESSEWWDSEEARWVIEELFEALDAHAPDGAYFGTHPGDGSDFGFWENKLCH